MVSTRRRALLLLVILVLVACQLMSRRVIGLMLIDRSPKLEVIAAPAHAAVNQSFNVTVTTYGSSSGVKSR